MQRPSWWPRSWWPGAGKAEERPDVTPQVPRPGKESGERPRPGEGWTSLLGLVRETLQCGRATLWRLTSGGAEWRVVAEVTGSGWGGASARSVEAPGHPFTWSLKEELELQLPADRLGGDLQLGDLVGLQVLVEDPDTPDEDGHPPYLRWTDVAVMAAAPAEEPTADSVLAALREDVTMEELRGRPGARDTAVELPGGETVPGVGVEVGGVPAVAFADPRAGGDVTYWLEGGPGSAVADLGLYRTVAALHRRLGALQASEDRRPRAVYPEVRFELLPGVVFRLGDPGLAEGDESRGPRSALPTDVFVRAGGGG